MEVFSPHVIWYLKGKRRLMCSDIKCQLQHNWKDVNCVVAPTRKPSESSTCDLIPRAQGLCSTYRSGHDKLCSSMWIKSITPRAAEQRGKRQWQLSSYVCVTSRIAQSQLIRNGWIVFLLLTYLFAFCELLMFGYNNGVFTGPLAETLRKMIVLNPFSEH